MKTFTGGIALWWLCAVHTVTSDNTNCGHDHLIDRFLNSMDRTSMYSHQALADATRDKYDVHRALVETTMKPLRIALDLSKLQSDQGFACTRVGEVVPLDGNRYNCTANDILTEDKLDFITSVLLPEAQDYFSSILSVPAVATLKVPGIQCGNPTDWACCAGNFPTRYASPGTANADFLLHVTSRPVAAGVVAWAIPCNIDQVGRPVSAQVNIGPQRISIDPAKRMAQLGTILHELTHALGFSQMLFGSYKPRSSPKMIPLQVSDGPNGTKITHLVTPKVKQLAQEYFDCPSVPGGELQSNNAQSYSSHWAKRLFLNEYMMATSTTNPIYSAFTLAAFEDSGWYQVNYARAQDLRYGHLAGCELATGRCTDWKAPLCYSSSSQDCTPDYTSKGICNLATLTSPIPPAFQFFSSPVIGGTDDKANYCPRHVPLSGMDCRGFGTLPSARGSVLEKIGLTSLCFRGALSKTTSSPMTASYCFAIQGCTATALKVLVGATVVLCPFNQSSVQVTVKDDTGATFQGTIACPRNPRDMCNVNVCSNMGVWTSKGCECLPGYTGVDCSELECPRNNETDQVCSNQGTCVGGACQCFEGIASGVACSRPPITMAKAEAWMAPHHRALLLCCMSVVAAGAATAIFRMRSARRSSQVTEARQTKRLYLHGGHGNGSYGAIQETLVLSIAT
ncbi:hypothetical protein H310_04465 [Aphanomyces invadans]|uniref:EGF-like domain-containing protein n=1 Tax=Aphanomyces invadans TaxID=157072 RepID=A0A024UCF1_9STRA|nr:hypothetical protein H310_04465 [Aphanomyces invadans]ETW04101.1 hypothetical protein H310_04465 [Aphanomyces invadans]|eukprot:XP_008867057.1 hypothetical protein H310_04465 [Aphanomyces invadans]